MLPSARGGAASAEDARGIWPLRRGLLCSALAALLGLAVANLFWLHHYRYALPFNIDEAGYLQRSIQYQQALDTFNLRQLVSHWQTPDIVAPVLPLLAGVVESIVHLSPWGIVGVEQVFYVLSVVGTYLLARQLLTVPWALTAAALVAGTPGLLDSSRLYFLSSPATALFVLTLWAQNRAGSFHSFRRSALWGVLLGVFCLTRSMAVALAPAFVLVAGLRAWNGSSRRRALRNAALGLSTAAIIVLSWYWTSWHAVYRYLTRYGYGSQADLYTSNKLSLLQRVHTRLVNIASQDLFLPLLLALLLALGLVFVLWGWRRWRASAATRASKQKGRSIYSHSLFDIAAVAVLEAAVLCSTSNSGSYFELPLVPVLIVMVAVPLARLQAVARTVVLASFAVALGLTLVDQFGLAPSLSDVSSVSIGGTSVVAFNDAQADFVGPKLRELGLGGVYWTNCGGATVTCFFGRTDRITVSYLERWTAVNREVERFVYSYGNAHGYAPVVFFAYQGPLLNTNTVGLAAQLSGESLPIGALLPPELQNGQSYRSQLESPLLGQPNFVIAEGNSSSRDGGESPPNLAHGVNAALQADGFQPVKEIPLPDASPLELWWKGR